MALAQLFFLHSRLGNGCAAKKAEGWLPRPRGLAPHPPAPPPCPIVCRDNLRVRAARGGSFISQRCHAHAAAQVRSDTQRERDSIVHCRFVARNGRRRSRSRRVLRRARDRIEPAYPVPLCTSRAAPESRPRWSAGTTNILSSPPPVITSAARCAAAPAGATEGAAACDDAPPPPHQRSTAVAAAALASLRLHLLLLLLHHHHHHLLLLLLAWPRALPSPSASQPPGESLRGWRTAAAGHSEAASASSATHSSGPRGCETAAAAARTADASGRWRRLRPAVKARWPPHTRGRGGGRAACVSRCRRRRRA